MTNFIENPYDTKNEFYKKFYELLKDTPLNKWKRAPSGDFVYRDTKGFYHVCELKKLKYLYYIDDYRITPRFEKEIAHTSSLNDLEQAIKFLRKKEK